MWANLDSSKKKKVIVVVVAAALGYLLQVYGR
jgi:hypothetical protein